MFPPNPAKLARPWLVEVSHIHERQASFYAVSKGNEPTGAAFQAEVLPALWQTSTPVSPPGDSEEDTKSEGESGGPNKNLKEGEGEEPEDSGGDGGREGGSA